MPLTSKLIVVALSAFLWTQFSGAQAPPAPRRSGNHPRRAADKSPALPPAPVGPLQQVPMDQLPAAPPKIGYENGLLTIVAENSTLGDVLREVHKQTGASIDVPPNANERVVVKLGPGPAREVLASLLNGTSFNYVMVGSTSDPGALSSIVLSSKPSGPATPANQTAQVYEQVPLRGGPQGFPARPPVVINQGVQAQATTDDASEDDAEEADDTADEDQNQNQAGQADASGVVQPQPPNAGPKTPEQILEMLRRPIQPNAGQQPEINQQDNNQPPE